MPKPAPRSDEIPVESLRLDLRNYRLSPSVIAELEDEGDIIAHLERHFDLGELAESFIQDGYRLEEPLVGVEEDEGLTVVEGNRRLATLKLLLQSSARERLDASRRSIWEGYAKAADEAGHELTPVPIVIYETRKSVQASLGFRHVSGIAEWSAESKARYIADLVNEGHAFRTVARMIGSRSDYVRRQYYAHQALASARVLDIDTSRAERRFGVYYRALSSPLIRGFIGLDWEEESAVPPGVDSVVIDTDKVKQFRGFLSLLFGDDDHGPVISDSRQLTDLGRILGDEEAAGVLLAERDFDLALEIAGTDQELVFSQLRAALSRLRRVNGVAFEFVGNERIRDLAERCAATASQIVETIGEDAPAEEPEEAPSVAVEDT